jgi:hypothetical protein
VHLLSVRKGRAGDPRGCYWPATLALLVGVQFEVGVRIDQERKAAFRLLAAILLGFALIVVVSLIFPHMSAPDCGRSRNLEGFRLGSGSWGLLRAVSRCGRQ